MAAKKTVVRVVKKPGQFTTIHKGFLSNDQLGLDAMGLLAWLLAKPDDWKAHEGHIAASTGTARGRVRSSMRRLVECGYVRRSCVRDRRTGRILRWETVVFETPELATETQEQQPLLFEAIETAPNIGRQRSLKGQKPRLEQTAPVVENPPTGLPETGNPPNGEPRDGNQQLLRTNGTNTYLTEERRTKPSADRAAARDRLPARAGGSKLDAAPTVPLPPPDSGRDRGAAVVLSDEQLVSLLVERAYFPLGEASSLLARHGPEACTRALLCLVGSRKPPANRRGFVVESLQRRWQPPQSLSVETLLAPKKQPALPVATPCRQSQTCHDDATDAALAGLSSAEWSEHLAAVEEQLDPLVRRMLEQGKPPAQIRSVRAAVFERVKAHATAGSALGVGERQPMTTATPRINVAAPPPV